MGHLPEQGLDQRALAAAIGPDQGMHMTGAHLEADLIENGGVAQHQIDAVELQRRTDGPGDQLFGSGHAPAS